MKPPRGKKRSLLGGICIGVFKGQYYDSETGFHYNYQRYYDPSTGRYLRADPIGQAGGINLYTYVGNNPINETDPFALLDAKSAYNYWTAVGSSGAARAINGGVWDSIAGNSQAAGAAIMSSFIDFFGARAIQNNAELSGWYSAIEGCESNAWKHGGLAAGQIVLEAGAADILLKYLKYLRGTPKSVKPALKLGKHKSLTKWKNRWKRGEWTAKDIRETYKSGKQFKADNMVNKSNTATRYHNQKLNKSIVVDDVTGEILQLGKEGFIY